MKYVLQNIYSTSLHDKSADISKNAGSVETIWMVCSSLILLLLTQELNPSQILNHIIYVAPLSL